MPYLTLASSGNPAYDTETRTEMVAACGHNVAPCASYVGDLVLGHWRWAKKSQVVMYPENKLAIIVILFCPLL